MAPLAPSAVSGYAVEYIMSSIAGTPAGGGDGDYNSVTAVPRTAGSAGDDLSVNVDANGIWVRKSGTVLPNSLSGFNFPTGDPAGAETYGSWAKVGGTTLDARNHSALIIMDCQIGTYGGTNQEFYEINSVFNCGVDTNLKFYFNGVSGNLWPECGRNAFMIRSNGTNVRVDMLGRSQVTFALAPVGSSNIVGLNSSLGGGTRGAHNWRRCSYFTTGNVSDADTASLLEWAAQTYNISTRPTAGCLFFGDSLSSGFWGYAGESIPNYLANTFPQMRSYNFAFPGYAADSINSISLPKALVSGVLNTLPTNNRFAWVWSGANELLGSVASATFISNMTSVLTTLRSNGFKTIVPTVIPSAQPAALDATVAAREVLRREYNAWIRSGGGGLINYVIDLAAPYNTGGGTAAEVRASMTGNSHFFVPQQTTVDWVLNIDGIHFGPLGVRTIINKAVGFFGNLLNQQSFRSRGGSRDRLLWGAR
jgi:hypothetical protein